ncbi:MAG TPA: hypothetical protein DCL35_04260 [Candidatus Omnitrophica bacterium]|nr:hypothetical protein [Candidatus Omnitrophota bacterium]
MDYIKGSIKDYLKDLAAKMPAPGGGSAAALSAAMGASLLAMTCNFTLGKEKYRKYEPRIKKILAQALSLEKRFIKLVDDDIRAYASGDMERAIGVPAEVCFLSYDLMKLAGEVMQKGNRRLVSDAALAAVLAETSFVAGYLYVEANLRLLKSGLGHYKGLEKDLKPLKRKIRAMRKKVEVKVGYSA